MSERFNSQKKASSNLRKLLQERIEKANPRRKLATEETKLHKINLHIANISTGAAVKSIPTLASYYSGKAAVKIFLDYLGDEGEHVQVEHIDPGVLNTAMQNKLIKSEIETRYENRNFSKLRESGELREPDVTAQKIINTLIRKQIL